MVDYEKSDGKVHVIPWAYFRLCPFPQIAIRVIQLLNKEEAPLHKLSSLIASDPAFASEVLTLANSPLYAPRSRANSILEAVGRVGTKTIQGMCLTVAVRAYLGKSISQPTMKAIWHHNLACALIAEKLASFCVQDKDSAYTAGILHDIGRLAMAVIKPREYTELLQSHSGSAASILDREREIFGFDHCVAGQELISSWKLAPEFEAAIGHHHAESDVLVDESEIAPPPTAAPETNAEQCEGWNLDTLVRISCRIADLVGFPAFRGCEVEPDEQQLRQFPILREKWFSLDLATLAAEISAKIHEVEAV